MKNNDFNKRLARYLKETRKRLGYTAPEVAKAINRSVDSIYSYEEGNRTLPLELIIQLSEFYGVSIDDIVRSKVTSGRTKAISFDLYKNNKKEALLIDQQNDDVVLYEVDEWCLKYYVKCADLRLDSEVLINNKGTIMPARISYDESTTSYLIHDIEKGVTSLFKKKKFMKDIIVIGDYAGTINKQIKVKNFFD
ncbi:MAG: helix-turn-helix domain-containing protein [Bacilli bacterium]